MSTDDMASHQPGEQEPLGQLFREVLDLVDETVEQVTDDDVDARLRQLLDTSCYCRQAVGPGPAVGSPGGVNWAPAGLLSAGGPADVAGWEEVAVARNARLQANEVVAAARREAKAWAAEARQAAQAAREQAERILADARAHADAMLNRAAGVIDDAHERAERIVADAHEAVEQLTAAAQVQAGTQTGKSAWCPGNLPASSALGADSERIRIWDLAAGPCQDIIRRDDADQRGSADSLADLLSLLAGGPSPDCGPLRGVSWSGQAAQLAEVSTHRTLLVVTGAPGSGKSATAAALAAVYALAHEADRHSGKARVTSILSSARAHLGRYEADGYLAGVLVPHRLASNGEAGTLLAARLASPPHLQFTPEEWETFLVEVKAGEFNDEMSAGGPPGQHRFRYLAARVQELAGPDSAEAVRVALNAIVRHKARRCWDTGTADPQGHGPARYRNMPTAAPLESLVTHAEAALRIWPHYQLASALAELNEPLMAQSGIEPSERAQLTVGEAEEPERTTQAGSGPNLDAGFTAITRSYLHQKSPSAGTDDSCEPQTLTEALAVWRSRPAEHMENRSRPRVLFAVDVVGFSEHRHDAGAKQSVRRALYDVLARAFGDAQFGWDDCLPEDRGDGVLIIVPEYMQPAMTTGPLVDRLHACLRQHNVISDEITKIRLRVAVHSGEIHRGGNGVSGSAITHLFRLLDAPALKNALAASAGADLALIVSDRFYDRIIQRTPGTADPGRFRPVTVAINETRTRGWLHLPGSSQCLPESHRSALTAIPRAATDHAAPAKHEYSLAGAAAPPGILHFRWT
jgi:hypothetical protein